MSGVLTCGGVNAGSGSITCGVISASGSISTTAGLTCTSVNAGTGAVTCGGVSASGSISSVGGYTGGAFTGAGINMPSQGCGCNSLSIYYNGTIQAQATVVQQAENLPSANIAYFLNIANSGANAALMMNGNQVIDSTGIYIGKGLQSTSAVYAGSFGIYNVAVGVSGSFRSADNKTVTVNGGIITAIV
jgi:hypothetical protein